MNEQYSEYAVELSRTAGGKVLRILAAAGSVLAFFLGVLVFEPFFLLALAGAVWSFVLFRSGTLEYETIFLDGTLEIAAIYNKTRRKQLFQCEMKEVLGYKLGGREEAGRLGRITKDYSSRRAGELCCVMKVSGEKGTDVVCFEPGKELAEILEKRYRALKA